MKLITVKSPLISINEHRQHRYIDWYFMGIRIFRQLRAVLSYEPIKWCDVVRMFNEREISASEAQEMAKSL